MKKIIGLCVLTLTMTVLSGCNDSAKDVSGAYTSIETSFSGGKSTVKIELDKLDKGKGYNITLSSTEDGSDVFSNSYDWGSGVLVEDFIIRNRDDKKVFQVLDGGSLKRIDIQEQSIFTKVEG